MDPADDQLAALKEKVSKLETYFKVGIAIAGIFGIAGGWGANALSNANSQISRLQTSIADLTTKAGEIKGRFDGIDRELALKVSDISNKLEADAKVAVSAAAKADLDIKLANVRSNAAKQLVDATPFVVGPFGNCPAGFVNIGLMLWAGQYVKLNAAGFGLPTGGADSAGKGVVYARDGWPYMHSLICKRT